MRRRRPAFGARTPRSLVGGAASGAFTVDFDGRPVPALAGQSLAAALWSAGILTWRTTRVSGAPRGVFCGMGSCYDCLVTVDGHPNQRACLTPARPGATVTTQEGTGRADLTV
ncbi:(2Fe-2S)-binding protein [Streptomyces sp. NPDC016459]|uniref:(2Fe-2S)-binding protein n=1 Tax=Streptomyces sp. NPDC016459 TaxID=3157190 RepID=UPI003409ABFF